MLFWICFKIIVGEKDRWIEIGLECRLLKQVMGNFSIFFLFKFCYKSKKKKEYGNTWFWQIF